MLPSTGEDVNLLFQAGVSDMHAGNGTLESVKAGSVAASCGGRKVKPR